VLAQGDTSLAEYCLDRTGQRTVYISVSVATAGATVLRGTGSESTANDVSAHAFMLAAVDSLTHRAQCSTST